MAKRKQTEVVQVPVRMQERLRAALEKAAKGRGEKTSLNSEIVRRLEMSLSADQQLILAYGGHWLSVIRLGGDLAVALPISWDHELGIDEDLVPLKIGKDDLNRIRNFFTGAPPPYNMSNAELGAKRKSGEPTLAERLQAEQRRREEPRRDEASALETEAARRKAELVVEARHLSGNPNMLVDEALTYLAKRRNAKAEAILNELRHRTPIKPLKRA